MYEERIDPLQSGIGLLVEHLVRYEFVSQVMGPAPCNYFDLGCGNGFGLKTLLFSTAGHLYGFDLQESALANAAQYLGDTPRVHLFRADLTAPESFAQICELASSPGDRKALVCFEVIEHLQTFLPVVRFLNDHVKKGADIFFSVPNDAFWGVQTPFHASVFGERSLQELLQLFDFPASIYKQYPVQGAIILPEGTAELTSEHVGKFIPEPYGRRQSHMVASHFIIHMGSTQPASVSSLARLSIADLGAERQWTSQREANLLYYKQEMERLQELANSTNNGKPVQG